MVLFQIKIVSQKTVDFLYFENRSSTPSVEDLAWLRPGNLLLRVDWDVEELSVAITLSLESCALAI